MKRTEFIRGLLDAGCIFLKHGARHDLYINPVAGKKQPIPRHNEIDDILAKHIKKKLGIS
ncbi:MAG: addiction module toxin, HicA family [Nitrospirae bacterium YQR-1]